MKVYLVTSHIKDTLHPWDDPWTVAVFSTREKAEAWIAQASAERDHYIEELDFDPA